jgi:hypothetical protein
LKEKEFFFMLRQIIFFRLIFSQILASEPKIFFRKKLLITKDDEFFTVSQTKGLRGSTKIAKQNSHGNEMRRRKKRNTVEAERNV